MERARPGRCPICGKVHPLRYHGSYTRSVYEHGPGWLNVKILRYLCTDCGHTVSMLPEFLTPYKRYSLREISRTFHMVFVRKSSLGEVCRSLLSAVMSTILGWISDWSRTCRHLILKGFGEAGILPPGAQFPGGDPREWAFSVCEQHVFAGALQCDPGNCGEYAPPGDRSPCGNQRCREILPVVQLRLQGLSPPLWPLRNP